jgi:hypothetical protein
VFDYFGKYCDKAFWVYNVCFVLFVLVLFDTFFTPISVQRVNGRDARRNGRSVHVKGSFLLFCSTQILKV